MGLKNIFQVLLLLLLLSSTVSCDYEEVYSFMHSEIHCYLADNDSFNCDYAGNYSSEFYEAVWMYYMVEDTYNWQIFEDISSPNCIDDIEDLEDNSVTDTVNTCICQMDEPKSTANYISGIENPEDNNLTDLSEEDFSFVLSYVPQRNRLSGNCDDIDRVGYFNGVKHTVFPSGKLNYWSRRWEHRAEIYNRKSQGVALSSITMLLILFMCDIITFMIIVYHLCEVKAITFELSPDLSPKSKDENVQHKSQAYNKTKHNQWKQKIRMNIVYIMDNIDTTKLIRSLYRKRLLCGMVENEDELKSVTDCESNVQMLIIKLLAQHNEDWIVEFLHCIQEDDSGNGMFIYRMIANTDVEMNLCVSRRNYNMKDISQDVYLHARVVKEIIRQNVNYLTNQNMANGVDLNAFSDMFTDEEQVFIKSRDAVDRRIQTALFCLLGRDGVSWVIPFSNKLYQK